MFLTLSEIEAAVTEAGDAPSIPITGVSTDTRTLEPGNLFVALASPKDDGHRFVTAAVKAGAGALLVSQKVQADDVPVIRVPDTTVAYGRLARAWRDRFAIPVVAVTGSVGKTTTKEMLAAALSPLGSVMKTVGNQNTETGVPMTLLGLTSEHRAAVVEMGMRGSGQIAQLAEIARPTIGLITRIADNHIELLGSLDAIADAKGELFAALAAEAVALVNADDHFASRLREMTQARVVSFGTSETADFQAVAMDRQGDGWTFLVGGTRITLSSPSRHDIVNACAAFAAARIAGVDASAAAAALAEYTAPPMRMQVVTATRWRGAMLIDAYNAAPASMRSALETLHHYAGGRKIAFLGDMKELGEHAVIAHRQIGEYIRALGGLDQIYTVGALAAEIGDASDHFDDSHAAAEFARTSLVLRAGDVVLVKGSRAMAMERVAEGLGARFNDKAEHA